MLICKKKHDSAGSRVSALQTVNYMRLYISYIITAAICSHSFIHSLSHSVSHSVSQQVRQTVSHACNSTRLLLLRLPNIDNLTPTNQPTTTCSSECQNNDILPLVFVGFIKKKIRNEFKTQLSVKTWLVPDCDGGSRWGIMANIRSSEMT